MAVTVKTQTLSAYWTAAELMSALNTLLGATSGVGFHSAGQVGQVTTLGTATGGGTLAAERNKRYLVSQYTGTTGGGTGVVLDVTRNQLGAISTVTLVHGGANFTSTGNIIVNGADIGGVTGTDNLTVPFTAFNSTLVGGTNSWYVTDSATYGVCCVTHGSTGTATKRFKQTYYSFYVPSFSNTFATNPTLYIRASQYITPSGALAGVSTLDYYSSASIATTSVFHHSLVISASNATPLTIKAYQSTVNPSFVAFQFEDTTAYGNLYRKPFILTKHGTDAEVNALPWDLNDCFSGAVYDVIGTTQNSDGAIGVLTNLGMMGKRQGEWGYTSTQSGNNRNIYSIYEANFGKRWSAATTALNYTTPVIYGRTEQDQTQNSLKYNPVITGIPCSYTMLPVPWYWPTDFGLTEIVGTNSPGFRDTVKIGATTTWTVLQFGNLDSTNSCMAFVAKTVD